MRSRATSKWIHRGIAASFALFLTACPQKTAVWVEEGSTAGHLVLGIGSRRGHPGDADIGVVRVYRCDRTSDGPGASWLVGPMGRTEQIKRLVYGETPSGFSSEQGPEPLTPGCYKVATSGTGTTGFTVDSLGTVTETRQR